MKPQTMWAVGPDDGAGWEAINAQTEAGARAQWAERNGQHDLTEWIVALRRSVVSALRNRGQHYDPPLENRRNGRDQSTSRKASSRNH